MRLRPVIPKFFLGTDSAPHSRDRKETSVAVPGVILPCMPWSYMPKCFEQAGALDKLEAFASFHGPDFYQLPRNTEKITLNKTPWQIPSELPFPEAGLVPLRAGGRDELENGFLSCADRGDIGYVMKIWALRRSFPEIV